MVEMSESKLKKRNYLERKPLRNQKILWEYDDENKVVLKVANTGFFNRVAQGILKKPEISHIHLDENGSFLWALSDGEKTITELGVLVKKQFGEKAEPLYERLVKYFAILESYKFIEFRE